MSNEHLTDSEMQQYALGELELDAALHAHFRTCNDCRQRVLSYQAMFISIAEQPVPSFDFDLQGLVMDNIPVSSRRVMFENWWIWLLAGIGVIATGILIGRFGLLTPKLFGETAKLVVYLIVPAFITLLLFLLIEMYRNYKEKIKILELS